MFHEIVRTSNHLPLPISNRYRYHAAYRYTYFSGNGLRRHFTQPSLYFVSLLLFAGSFFTTLLITISGLCVSGLNIDIRGMFQ